MGERRWERWRGGEEVEKIKGGEERDEENEKEE